MKRFSFLEYEIMALIPQLSTSLNTYQTDVNNLAKRITSLEAVASTTTTTTTTTPSTTAATIAALQTSVTTLEAKTATLMTALTATCSKVIVISYLARLSSIRHLTTSTSH